MEVPATAEGVIECKVDMNKTVMEGPLGEYTGYYTPPSLKPVGRVTAITHRKGALFQGLLTGKPVTENHILKQIPFEASFLRSEEHTSELQSLRHLVCRLLLEKKKRVLTYSTHYL